MTVVPPAEVTDKRMYAKDFQLDDEGVPVGRIAGVSPPRFNLPERANSLGAFAWQKLGDWTKRDLAVKERARRKPQPPSSKQLERQRQDAERHS